MISSSSLSFALFSPVLTFCCFSLTEKTADRDILSAPAARAENMSSLQFTVPHSHKMRHDELITVLIIIRFIYISPHEVLHKNKEKDKS